MQVTSLEQLKNIKKTEVVELPPFIDGTQFIAELRRPNIMNLMINGSIPNSLLSVASDMFQKGQKKTKETIDKAINNNKDMQDLFKLLQVIAKDCLVNPSYKDLEEVGIQLTEMQLTAIMNYTQGGVQALEPFRNK